MSLTFYDLFLHIYRLEGVLYFLVFLSTKSVLCSGSVKELDVHLDLGLQLVRVSKTLHLVW